MANPEHVRHLMRGVQEWNSWRAWDLTAVPDFSAADLAGANLSGADLSGTDLSGADLAGAQLAGAKLRRARLAGATLAGAGLDGADLREAGLEGAMLRAARLEGAEMTAARLVRADLADASLRGAVLCGAELSGANLAGADLAWAVLSGADLSAANLAGVRLFATVFGDVDLRGALGLASCVHDGPSVVDGPTLARAGALPAAFLAGCGLAESAARGACFIDFVADDAEFATLLAAELGAVGVRCWLWQEAAEGGVSRMDRLGASLRGCDRLIVVCSQRALESRPLVRAAERALERRADLAGQGNAAEILLLLRLDDAIAAWDDKIRALHPQILSDAYVRWDHAGGAELARLPVIDYGGWRDAPARRAALDALLRVLA